jgi:hypothetical protein
MKVGCGKYRGEKKNYQKQKTFLHGITTLLLLTEIETLFMSADLPVI